VKDKTSAIFGQNLKKRRLQKKLSQKVVGELAGLTMTYIGQLERGKMGVSLRTAKRIADALGCRLEDLIQGL
jgi:transcriptional regulator with XRE-family HTH domain